MFHDALELCIDMNKEEELIRKKSPVNIKNKKASFEYFFIETFTAGIVLTGTEIKSIRMGKASLVDTYCFITNGEIWVRGMNVSPYFYGSYNNHEIKRDRKLLLTKREIQKLASATKQTGYTIVPLQDLCRNLSKSFSAYSGKTSTLLHRILRNSVFKGMMNYGR